MEGFLTKGNLPFLFAYIPHLLSLAISLGCHFAAY
jgi:hypothetical protein